MKKSILICSLAAGALLASCKKQGFLDNKADTAINETYVFTDSLRTMQFLTRVYQDVGFSFRKWRWHDHGNTEQSTDDAEYTWSGPTQTPVIIYNGSLSPSSYVNGNSALNDFWNLPYENIRRVNLLIAKLPLAPLSEGKKKRMVAEARFLRAWYYHNLLIAYGGVPLLDDQVFSLTDVVNKPRNTYAECVDYVVRELDAAAAELPAPGGYEDADHGRVTRGAALALKARLLLYAASPLFNATQPYVGSATEQQVKTTTYGDSAVSRWQRAAQAAEDLINTGYYSLNVDNATAPGYGYYDLFQKRVNSEYIFFYNRPANRDWEGFYFPGGFGGSKYVFPSHNLAVAFPMSNGKAITDPASGYNAANPFANRDPRFGYSIIYNGMSIWRSGSNSKQPVWTYEGASDGNGFVATNQNTGYFVRKMTNTENGNNTDRGWGLIRFAEILLNYAEAINETGQTALAYPKLKLIRERAGIEAGADGLYGMKANMTKEEMREFIRNERRIELAFEDHRYHDIRRWKIAMQVNNGFNDRLRIVRGGTSPNFTYTYTVVPSIRRHNFRPEHYLMPLPELEVRRMPAMVQNPGY
ncbi:RagB/SusD family nutrient uptake outer membrane protein [Paraflavisolibacter sp. H34]|uniref:RagB/SusD family nutrient uptake outer membrane protein n=1 Tax=Huijunlia imazamoxiresistens TaxID=3127457 RepID=UPI003015E2D9